jgi:2-polyprenyl-6-methoxyphenol hydroxylase-like FAD-dependent oxidoreductase
MPRQDVPVLISGGGPVGLVLALCLSRLGVRSLVVNDRKATTTHPKLDVVNCRSMELFRQIGLAEKIRDAGNPRNANQYCSMAASASGPFYSVMSDRHLIYQSVDQGDDLIRRSAPGTLPLESMQRIAQMHLEPVFLAEAQEDPNIEVRFGWRLLDYTEDADGVTGTIQAVAGGASESVRAQYIAGCDGPGSRVRAVMGIEYDNTKDLVGELFIVHFRSDEVAKLYPNNEPYWHTWIARPGFGGLLVSPDAARNDYVLHRPFAPRKGETIESIINAALGTKLRYEVIQSGAWRPQFLVAESYSKGRAFIVGDAAHQYMPTGGLGMNTGVAEAHNLAWKLAAAIQGWGGPLLLESYQSERLPVGRRNRDHAKVNGATIFEVQFDRPDYLLEESTRGALARRDLGAAFERRVSRLYESLGVEIGYIYRDSPVIVPDAAPAPGDDTVGYVPTSYSGARLPSAFFSDGRAVYDALAYDSFTLLVLDSTSEWVQPLVDTANQLSVPLKVILIQEDHLRRLYEKRAVLVRPDQHVAWRSDSLPLDCFQLLNIVRGA